MTDNYENQINKMKVENVPWNDSSACEKINMKLEILSLTHLPMKDRFPYFENHPKSCFTSVRNLITVKDR